MAQGLLRSGAGAVLLGGVAAELAAGLPPPRALLDWVVGAAFVVAALRSGRAGSALLLLTAAAWYAGTLADPSLAFAALLYRGPLLHVLAGRTPVRRLLPALVALGYGLACFPTTWAALATAALAAALGVLVLGGSRRRPDAGLLIALALLWTGTALGLVTGRASEIVSAGVLLLVAGHLSRAGWMTGAVDRLVLELGPTDRPAAPLSTTLGAALADPDLEIFTFQPGVGWSDEPGRPAADPTKSAGAVSEVPIADGGRVVIRHGPGGAGDTDFARAAAGAAALVLERLRLGADVRRESESVRRSAGRLLTAGDAERQALAERLRAGPIGRLEGLRAVLDPAVTPDLDRVIDDLDRLALGLYPAAVDRPLPEALAQLAAGTGLPVQVDLATELAALPVELRALVYFVSAECLTNVVHHAGATQARVTVLAAGRLVVEVTDDGHGGATLALGRGLQGLADRVGVAGGVLTIESPPGGPTLVRADVQI